jgi:hypothetical protein
MSGHPEQFVRHICVPVLAALLFALALVPTGASAASPELFAGVCDRGGGADQCGSSDAIAVDPSSGNVYVADASNNRVDEFGPWGDFLKAWGGGVLNGGATATGSLTAGSPNVTSVTPIAKAFVPGMLVEGTGVAPGTTIAAVQDQSLVLSKPATSAAVGETTLSSPEAPGNVPTNELQEITVTATGGSFNLQFIAGGPDYDEQTTTANLPYNASAAQVQSALEGLSNIGAGNVAVTSANPGGEAGVSGGPYTVEFKGSLYSDTDVRELHVTAGTPALSGGMVKVMEITNGASAPELCTGLVNCRKGVQGSKAGQLAGLSDIAIDPQGDLYLYETYRGYRFYSCSSPECETRFEGNSRVQKFDSDGNFLLMFGGDVNEGGGSPSNPGDICTAQDLANGDVCGGGTAGEGDGQFGTTEGTGLEFELGVESPLAVGPAGQVYVGDKDRIQRFDSSGNYTGQILLPEPGLVGSLAVSPGTGDLYFRYGSPLFGETAETEQPNVHRLDSVTGNEIGEPLEVDFPGQIEVAAGGDVYVIGKTVFLSSGDKRNHPSSVFRFSSDGKLLEKFLEGEFQSFAGHREPPRGFAASSACGGAGATLYFGGVNIGNLEVGAFGPTPNPAICPPSSVAPQIINQYVTSVDTTGATLKASINPEFWTDTTYYVQYGTGKCSEGGCDKEQPLAPRSKLTSAVTNSAITTAGIFLGGLEPATTYHYRFVAQSSGGGPVRGVGGEVGKDGEEGTFTTFPQGAVPGEGCSNQIFRISASAKLPDCRAYEMVSPVDKNGGDVVYGELTRGFKAPRRTSPDGNRFTFTSLRSFADPAASPLVNQYLSNRGADGWATESIATPRGVRALWNFGFPGPYKAFSEDLCSAWLLEDSDFALTPDAPPGVVNLYRRSNCGSEPAHKLLTNVVPLGVGPGGLEPEYEIPVPQGFSADETHTVFLAGAAMTPNACKTAGIAQVYVTSEEGPMRLVSVLPNGTVTCNQSSAGTFLGTIDSMVSSSLVHAISSDGSRVFWTETTQVNPQGFVGGLGKLYVRLNATQPPSKPGSGCSEPDKACTLPIYTAGQAFFWGANAEGTKAIYVVGKQTDELYEYEVAEEKSTLIAKGVHYGHYGVAGMSEDASRIYFTSKEILTAAPNSEGDAAQAGQPNLYLYEAGEGGGSYTFIGTLAANDGRTTSSEPGLRSSRVTPDGMHLAFAASTPLTGYDNADRGSGAPASELYTYDAEAGGPGKLRCVSCNPSGARPAGRADTGGVVTSATIPGWPDQLRPSRLLTEDGNRLFFQSYDALLPADSNGAQDVYEWQRADGAGACKEAGAQLYVPSAEGCISLISTGQSPEDSELLEANKGGADVFFITNSILLPQDPGLYDVYDARIGGGYPPPPARPPSCEGEACQGAPAPPNDPTPASSAFEGAGNVVEGKAKQKKGKQKKAKQKKAHKHKKKAHKKAKKQADKTRRAGR